MNLHSIFKVFLLVCVCFNIKLNAIPQPKILILVISSNNQSVYKFHERAWRSYMEKYPENIDVYFLKAKKDSVIKNEVILKDDTIWSNSEENYIPGILIKTLRGYEFFKKKLDNYQFIIRTNCNTFFVMDRLLKYLEGIPAKNTYIGMKLSHLAPKFPDYASGAGVIYSSDIIQKIVQGKNSIIAKQMDEVDDVIIGDFLFKEGVNLKNINIFQILSKHDEYQLSHFLNDPDPAHFQIRLKYPVGEREINETKILRILLNHFYHVDL